MTETPDDLISQATDWRDISTAPKLSTLESKCMAAWRGCDPDFGYLSFAGISCRSGVPQHLTRRVTRALARKGMVQFARGLWDEDGEMRGSGYGLTKCGHDWIASHGELPSPPSKEPSNPKVTV